MSVDFTDAENQNIKFPPDTSWISTTKSITLWFYPDTLSAAHVQELVRAHDAGDTSAAGIYWYILSSPFIGAVDPGKFLFTHLWSGSQPGWYTTNDVITAGQWNHIGVTYDGSSSANDAVLYVDGVSVAVTEAIAPSGTIDNGANSEINIGSYLANVFSPDGKIASVVEWDRILTPAEMFEAYSSRLAVPSESGPVFAPNLSGAATLQTFDGTTLTSSHKIIDQISGAVGTPTGSPVGRSDTLLTYE